MKRTIFILISLFMLTNNFNLFCQSSWAYGTGIIYTNNPLTSSLGVGIASPARQLHVQTSQTNGGLRITQTTTGFSALELYNTSTGGRNYAIVSTGNGNTTEGVGNFGIYDYTSAAYRFFINSSGNIGIGTYSIGSKLQVNGNAAIGYSASTAAPSNGLCVSGNIGIGTTSPSQKLEVNGNISLTGNGTNGNSTINGQKSQGSLILDANTDPNDGASIVLYGSSSANYPSSVRHISYLSNGKIVFSNYTGSAWLDQMVINANGSVGIGLSTPNSSTLLSLKGKGASSSTLSLNISNSNDENLLYVRDDGKVGIGLGSTTFPTDYLLAVGGKIIAEEVKIKLKSQWPDFVFDNSYKMMSLLEIEKYINENKHLPNVPTANEVKEDGISVGEMNVILVQKVEELTLYLINQNKKIEELQKVVDDLKNK